MTNTDQTGLQDAGANTALGAPRYTDFGELIIKEPDLIPLPRALHVSHVTDARFHLLAGMPQRTIDILSSVPIPDTVIADTDALHAALRARHLLAEALLEIGSASSLRQAADHCMAGLVTAANCDLRGKEPLYTAGLYATFAEAVRRRDGAIDADTASGLLELLAQTAGQADNRYRAIEYVGFRALALSFPRRSEPRLKYLDQAAQAREAFLASAGETPRQQTFKAERDQDKLRKPRVSPLLSALIDFPYPSQGQPSHPSASRRSRRHY